MTVADTYGSAQEELRASQLLVSGAYQRLFAGHGNRSDAAIVLGDLHKACGAARSPFRPGLADATAREIGKLEVWQRIEAFRFPDGRPQDAGTNVIRRNRRATHGRDDQSGEAAAVAPAGRGVAEPTDD